MQTSASLYLTSQRCRPRQLNPRVWNVFRENTIPSQIRVAIWGATGIQRLTGRQIHIQQMNWWRERKRKRKEELLLFRWWISFIKRRSPRGPAAGITDISLSSRVSFFLTLITLSLTRLMLPLALFPVSSPFSRLPSPQQPQQLAAKVEEGSACSSCEGADKQKSFRRSRLSVQLWFM